MLLYLSKTNQFTADAITIGQRNIKPLIYYGCNPII